MLGTSQGQVAHNVQTMSPTYCPARNYSNHHLGHKANQALYFQDIQPVVAVFPYIALVASGTLISTRAKGPFSILGRRPLSGKQDHSNGSIFLRIIEGIVEFGGSFGTEGIPHVRSVKRNSRHTIALFIGDVLVFLGSNPVDHDRLI